MSGGKAPSIGNNLIKLQPKASPKAADRGGDPKASPKAADRGGDPKAKGRKEGRLPWVFSYRAAPRSGAALSLGCMLLPEDWLPISA